MSGSTIPNDISALLSSPIEHFINTNVAILEGDKFTDQALNLMKEREVREASLHHVGEVVGIVSKTDILFKVMSQGRNPGKVRLREIMTSPSKLPWVLTTQFRKPCQSWISMWLGR